MFLYKIFLFSPTFQLLIFPWPRLMDSHGFTKALTKAAMTHIFQNNHFYLHLYDFFPCKTWSIELEKVFCKSTRHLFVTFPRGFLVLQPLYLFLFYVSDRAFFFFFYVFSVPTQTRKTNFNKQHCMIHASPAVVLMPNYSSQSESWLYLPKAANR